MKAKLSSTFFQVLGMAMLCCMIPSMNVAAEEVCEIRVEQDANGNDYYTYEFVEEDSDIDQSVLSERDGLPKLGTPTELEWGYDYFWRWENGEMVELLKEERPGSMAWIEPEPSQSQVDVRVYKDGDEKTYYRIGFSTTLPKENNGLRSTTMSCLANFESGTYYYEVTSLGDQINYDDSETATSGKWTYTKPDLQVGKCNNVSFVWPTVTWDAPTDDTYLGGYEVKFFYAATKYKEPISSHGSYSYSTYFRNTTTYARRGNGYYYVKVRALSSDITKACNGEWSELIGPFYVGDLADKVDKELDEILENNDSADTIKEAVQKMDTVELKTAMEADTDENGTIDKLKKLEEKVGGPADVQVTDDAKAFKNGKISIVGANLNSEATKGESISLVVDKPDKEDVIPAVYENAVAVRFGMNLDNVEDPENLEVPVKITMPVPSTINPDFLVILHYHAKTGKAEEIRPHVYKEGSQYYASFILTSFSDFAMTQKAVKVFSDVPADQWYYPYVLKAYNRGLVSGVSTDKTTGLVQFAPNAKITREQFVQILYSLEGKPAVEYKAIFTDVPEQSDTVWYSNAIMWASQNNVVAGYESGKFGVGDNITREQVATMLMAYAKYKGYATTEKADLSAFKDVNDISGYAVGNMQWAVKYGIMAGNDQGYLMPKGNSTRAEATTMLLGMLAAYE